MSGQSIALGYTKLSISWGQPTAARTAASIRKPSPRPR